jgi:imidazolonepropionase-like amidohydrolase
MDRIIIENANIFDGVTPDLIGGMSVLIEGSEILAVSDQTIRDSGAMKIDAAGKTLMPGLIDLHTHAYISDVDVGKVDRSGDAYRTAYGIKLLGHALDCGFTTVRDVGGGDWSMALAMNHGLVRSPRYFYSGKALSMTGGHGDLRRVGEDQHEGGAGCHCSECNSIAVIVDGVDACIRAAREELRKGAHCLKIMASGGVASATDPIWAAQYREDEIRAIVGEAAARGTYVAAHCNPPGAIRRAVACGVRTIEHGALIDKEAAEYVASQNAFVVPTLIVFRALAEIGQAIGLSKVSQDKAKIVAAQSVAALDILRSAGVPLGFGTDLIGDLYIRRCEEFTLRREVFSAYEILRQATSVGAEILMLGGKLGCVSAGAYADLLLVDGNPLADIDLLAQNGQRIPFIMKNGSIVKNEL